MRKFYEAIVDHKKTVIVFFTIAMIISALCSTMVNVNYDINDYLPDGTASTVALDKMNEEYTKCESNGIKFDRRWSA